MRDNLNGLVVLLLGVILLIVIVLLPPSNAQSTPSLAYVKNIDLHRDLITIDGKERLALDLEAVKEMRANEIKLNAATAEIAKLNDSLTRTRADLKRARDNEQDEKVRAANIKRDFDDQTKLLTSCMALSGNGSVVKNRWVQFGVDLAPTVATLLKPCH